VLKERGIASFLFEFSFQLRCVQFVEIGTFRCVDEIALLMLSFWNGVWFHFVQESVKNKKCKKLRAGLSVCYFK